MKLTITQNQYNQCNAGYFGNTLSKAQSGKTPSKTNSGPFTGCARCHLEPAEKAFKTYESRVNGALKSVININPKFVEYAQLKANPTLVNTQNKKFLSRIDKAQNEIKALDKQAKPLLDGLKRGKVEDVDAKTLRDDRAVQIFAEGATNFDLHLLRTNFKAIKIVKQATGEWVKKEQKENNPQLDPDQSQTNQEDPFRSDVRSINRLVKTEQEKRKSIELDKLQKKTNENIEAESEFVHKNQLTGDGTPLDIPTEYQTLQPQSDEDKTGDSLSSGNSDKEQIGNENSLVVDPLKIQPPLGQQDGLTQTDQQQHIDQN